MGVDELINHHAPSDWHKELPPTRLESLIKSRESVPLIVVAGDIRSSTFIMKEAIDFRLFANALNAFVDTISKTLRDRRGWFDKFTGDGFLAYWVLEGRPETDYLSEIIKSCRIFLRGFHEEIEPDLRRNSRNFPKRTGLSIGLDSGPGYFAKVAGDLTIIGPPVVGAVRMVATAEPYEIITNVHLAEQWLQKPDLLREQNVALLPEVRPTKEYVNGQIVYKVGPHEESKS